MTEQQANEKAKEIVWSGCNIEEAIAAALLDAAKPAETPKGTRGEIVAKLLVEKACPQSFDGERRVDCNADMLEAHLAEALDAEINAERDRCATIAERCTSWVGQPGATIAAIIRQGGAA